MAASMMKPCSRTAAFGSAPMRPAVAPRPMRAATISHSYKNGENIDLSKVAQYARHEKDTGSPEAQVARLTARVAQLSPHLIANKKDHAAKRGLQAVLNQRKKLLQYLYKEDRESYYKIISDFGIRAPVVNDVRGATRVKSDAAK
mmetsp:Transcript_70380/g.155236  ORF Transcript_70380/g.155236 Transcript_70380/m.155236 type:complete len:145 (+) Transcript_70380:27-461(+)